MIMMMVMMTMMMMMMIILMMIMMIIIINHVDTGANFLYYNLLWARVFNLTRMFST